MRRIVGLLAASVLMFALVASAQTTRTDREALELIGQILVEQGIVLPTTTEAPTTTAAPATTLAPTTTVAPTTTQSPTTTVPATTTTVAPTTTAAPVIPATVPHPRITADLGNGYIFNVGRQMDADTGFEGVFWSAPYLGKGDITDSGQNLPYAPGYQWVPGDRIAYDCVYAFLAPSNVTLGTAEERMVGRVTFIMLRDPAGDDDIGYALVSDKHMKEGLFYWDGTPLLGQGPGGLDESGGQTDQAYKAGWCDQDPLTTSYGPPSGPGQLPRIVFWVDGEVVEIRDYRGVTVELPNGVFRVTDVITEPFETCDGVGNCVTVNSRVTVVFYHDGVSKAVVYYDGIGDGRVTVDFP